MNKNKRNGLWIMEGEKSAKRKLERDSEQGNGEKYKQEEKIR